MEFSAATYMFFVYFSSQYLFNLFFRTLLILTGQLWEWASALPGFISPPGGVAGIVRE